EGALRLAGVQARRPAAPGRPAAVQPDRGPARAQQPGGHGRLGVSADPEDRGRIPGEPEAGAADPAGHAGPLPAAPQGMILSRRRTSSRLTVSVRAAREATLPKFRAALSIALGASGCAISAGPACSPPGFPEPSRGCL